MDQYWTLIPEEEGQIVTFLYFFYIQWPCVCVCVRAWIPLTEHKVVSVTVTAQHSQAEHLFCLNCTESVPTNTAV